MKTDPEPVSDKESRMFVTYHTWRVISFCPCFWTVCAKCHWLGQRDTFLVHQKCSPCNIWHNVSSLHSLYKVSHHAVTYIIYTILWTTTSCLHLARCQNQLMRLWVGGPLVGWWSTDGMVVLVSWWSTGGWVGGPLVDWWVGGPLEGWWSLVGWWSISGLVVH